MSVFLDSSKHRKIYFRTAVVIFSISLISIVTFFAWSLVFGNSIDSPAVKYSDTVESYHYYYSPANKKKIALTFDDGPKPDITLNIAKILKENNVPGMFFFVGQEIILKPNIVSKVSKMGFDIGNHSFTHREDIHSSQNRLALELRTTNYLLSEITGKSPLYYRPPFLLGIGVDPTVNPYTPIPQDVLWSLEDGLIPNGIDIDSKDWLATSPKDVVVRLKDALDKSPNGHIILLHEEERTVLALQSTIDLLKKEGYSLVSLPELLTPPKEISLTQTLAIGSKDENTLGEVSKLQWFLYEQEDLDPYLLTGIFDTATRNALTSFQLRNHLIDPSNVDPKRAGIADETTREIIRHNSLRLAIAIPTQKSGTKWDKILTWLGSILLIGYVNLVPFFRQTLIWMIRVALGLVIIRCLFITITLSVRWYGKRYKSTKILTKEEKKHRGVSVLIPAYNEEENIRGTIESVIGSVHARKEIIVIDDGSTDKTAEIARSVISANPQESIRLLQIENGGKANALNHGIEVSRFDICVVIDADAVLGQNALYHFTKHFKDPDVGAVAGRVRTTGNNGFLNLFQMLEYAIGQNIDKRALSTLGAVGVVPGPAGAWDKTSVKAAGGFSNETLVEDQDMTLTLLRMGKKVIYEEKAVAYTETPNTITNFLKQRFRWIYGTIQCFWKNKAVFAEQPASVMSLIVMPNIFIFNILLPLTYPFADGAFVVGLIFGEWQTMVLPFILFTIFDLLYAWIGVWNESEVIKLLSEVPLQRVSYRQLLYYTVIRSVVRAIEGTSSSWNKFAKTGETQRFYFSSARIIPPAKIPSGISISSEWISEVLVSSGNLKDSMSLSTMSNQFQDDEETLNPA